MLSQMIELLHATTQNSDVNSKKMIA